MRTSKLIIFNVFATTVLLLVLLFQFSCSNAQEKQTVPPVAEITYDTITDADGNAYSVVKIGQQKWIAENLKVTTFDCGDSIEVLFTNGVERGPDVKFYDNQPRYAYYDNRPDLGFGVIYNYATITKCSICPLGYRIPKKSDWETLINNLGGQEEAGKRLLKEGDSDFNAELGGRIDGYGSVLSGSFGFWFSQDIVANSGQQLVFIFELDYQGTLKLKGQDIRVGNYVRCVQ